MLALAHQAVAIVVLTLAILQVERLKPRAVAGLRSVELDLVVGKAA